MITGVEYPRMAALSEQNGRFKDVDKVLLAYAIVIFTRRIELHVFVLKPSSIRIIDLVKSIAYMGIHPQLLAMNNQKKTNHSIVITVP